MRSLHNRIRDVLHYGTDSGRFSWIATGKSASVIKGNGVVVVPMGKKKFKAEELALFYVTGKWPEAGVRFRNEDPQDLSYRNLIAIQREAGDAEHKKGNLSGVRGVIWYKPTRRWRARFQFQGKEYNCGDFFQIELAHMALNAKREEVGAPLH